MVSGRDSFNNTSSTINRGFVIEALLALSKDLDCFLAETMNELYSSARQLTKIRVGPILIDIRMRLILILGTDTYESDPFLVHYAIPSGINSVAWLFPVFWAS
jgi:hypothetical protein